MTLRRKGNLATERTVRLLVVVIAVLVFSGGYLMRNW